MARPDRKRWQMVKNGLLATGLSLSFLQYYFLDVYAPIASLPQVALVTSPLTR